LYPPPLPVDVEPHAELLPLPPLDEAVVPVPELELELELELEPPPVAPAVPLISVASVWNAANERSPPPSSVLTANTIPWPQCPTCMQ